MEATIILLPDGRVQIMIDRGAANFPEAKAALARLIEQIGAAGGALAEVGEVEQHLHTGEQAHAHHTTSAEARHD